jgi:hypothetical protein
MQLFKKETPHPVETLGAFRVDVVSYPEELDHVESLPAELQYLFQLHPAHKATARDMLSRGFAIGIRTTTATPTRLLLAVQRVTTYSQHNCILTWLPAFLRDKHQPTILPNEYALAEKDGVTLDEELTIITQERLRFKRLVLIDEENVGITQREQQLMTEFSEILFPLAIDSIVHRIVNDNAHERTAVAQNIIKALLIVGPIAHTLEHVASGVGKLFAASADDLLGETAELMALRGSGFTWKELSRRSIILIPVFALATYGALSVEPLLHADRILLGGAVFGLSAVALSLTTAIQSIGMYKKNVKKLIAEKKLRIAGSSPLKIAIVQDFTNPARLGLLLGAALAPVMGMIAAVLGLLSNGWILALVGSTESIVAGMTVIFANRINEWRFARSLFAKIQRKK